MLLKQLVKLTMFIIPLNGLRSNELRKTEAVDTINSDDIFEEILSSCDLTKNVCDINCCSDKDCSIQERDSFDCTQEAISEEIKLFDRHYCDIGTSEYLEARAMLCLQHANSPYLGEFYLEDDVYSNEVIPDIVQSRKKQLRKFLNKPKSTNTFAFYRHYNYGSYVLKYAEGTKKSKIHLPMNILKQTGFCVELPVRFMINAESNCLHTLSEEACLTANIFNSSHFIPHNGIDGGDGGNITIIPTFQCLRNGSDYVTFSRNIFTKTESYKTSHSDVRDCKGSYFTRLNKKAGICENVVVSLKYYLYRNQTSLTGAEVIVSIADIPLTIDSFLEMRNRTLELIKPINSHSKIYMHVAQSFKVQFKDDNGSLNNKKKGYKFRDLLRTVGNFSTLY